MFYGCQPKKFFYEAAETVARSRHLKGKGIETEAKGSWSSVREAKNRFTDKIPSGTREEGIDFLSGQARFLDGTPLRSMVGSSELNIPFSPPVPGPCRYLSWEKSTSSPAIHTWISKPPQRILFIGGGFISFEFAHFAVRLGPENSHWIHCDNQFQVKP